MNNEPPKIEPHYNVAVFMGRVLYDAVLKHTSGGVPYAETHLGCNAERPAAPGKPKIYKEQRIYIQRFNPDQGRWLEYVKEGRKLLIVGRVEGYLNDKRETVMLINVDRTFYLDSNKATDTNGLLGELERAEEQRRTVQEHVERLQEYNGNLKHEMKELAEANETWAAKCKELDEANQTWDQEYRALKAEYDVLKNQTNAKAPALAQKRARSRPTKKRPGSKQ